jgi:hypothetical protein
MSLVQAIRMVRSNGGKSTASVPTHIRQFKLALSRFMDSEHFGKYYASECELKPSPKHANGQHTRWPETFNTFRLCQTLEANKINQWFHFYVNTPTARFFTLMLDIDFHEDDGETDAWELALLILDNEFRGHHGKTWCETSRNGRGFYIYFQVVNPYYMRVDDQMGVDDFSRLLRRYNRYMREKYNGKEHWFNGEKRVFRAEVDAIKASPYFNLDWQKYERGEDRLDNRGTLATIPLTGIRCGLKARDLDSGRELIQKFVGWVKNYKKNAFPPSFFFSSLEPVPVTLPVVEERVYETGGGDSLNLTTTTSDSLETPSVPVTLPVIEEERLTLQR